MISELMLKIESDEYEVECKHDKWKGYPVPQDIPVWVKFYGQDEPVSGITCVSEGLVKFQVKGESLIGVRQHPKWRHRICPLCKNRDSGIGTRKVKLVGMVEFKMKYDYKLQQYKVRLLDWIADPCEFCVLAEKVTKAYRDGTLPEEIRNQLKEVPV